MPRLPALMLNPNSHNLVLADVTLHALYYSLVHYGLCLYSNAFAV